MANYGNSFGAKHTEPVGLERITLWDTIYERILVGATVPVSDATPEGTVIPAGTPVSVDKLGGTATLNADAPIALTEEDVVMGSEFATLTLVKRGVFYVSRSKATITEAQQAALPGITFVKEL